MTNTVSKEPAPIPLGALFRDVVLLSGVHRGRLWTRIRIPLLLLLAGAVLMASTGLLQQPAARMSFAIGSALCMVAMAIGVHREVLLLPVEGFGSGEGFAPAFWRMLRYLIASIGLVAAFVLVGRLVKRAANFLLAGMQLDIWAGTTQVLGSTVALIATSRCLLMLPAIATDTAHPLRSAWRQSRGNAWRVAFVFVLIPWVARAFLVWLYPHGVNSLEFVVLIVMLTLLGIFHVAAMSFAFRFTLRQR